VDISKRSQTTCQANLQVRTDYTTYRGEEAIGLSFGPSALLRNYFLCLAQQRPYAYIARNLCAGKSEAYCLNN
jgi:hypothetical protein